MACKDCREDDPCKQVDCTCRVKIGTDCVTYTGEDLNCVGVDKGTILTAALKRISEAVCEKFNSITDVISLKNIGSGAKIYAGDDVSGKKKIRSIINQDGTVNIEEREDAILISAVLPDREPQNTYTATSIGEGTPIYAGEEGLGENIEFRFKSIKYTDQPGMGVSVVKGIEDDGSNINIAFRKIVSPDINITYDDNEIRLKLPSSLAIPAIYVNSLHEINYEEWVSRGSVPYKGLGTLSKPITDTISFTPLGVIDRIPNTAIQNALDYYVGDTATYSKSNPQRIGERIIVLNNAGYHTFSGNFNYKGLNLINEGYILSTTTGYLLDMEDSAFATNSESLKIESRPQSVLEIKGEGFRNNGNNVATTNYVTGKEVVLLGEEGLIYSANTDVTKTIINASVDNNMNNNDGQLCFRVYTRIAADYQNIYKVGGKARVDFYGNLISGTLTTTVSSSLRAFHQTGGQVRMFKSAQVTLYGGVRTDGFTFESSIGRSASFIATGTVFTGQCVNLFNKLLTSSGDVEFNVTNSPSGYGLVVTEVFQSSKEWSVGFNQNNIAYGNINSGYADLTKGNTVGAINTINGQIIETLRKYPTKGAARMQLLTEKSAYIVERTVLASDFIVGVEYIVKAQGIPSIGQPGSYVIATEGMKSSAGAEGILHERCVTT